MYVHEHAVAANYGLTNILNTHTRLVLRRLFVSCYNSKIHSITT